MEEEDSVGDMGKEVKASVAAIGAKGEAKVEAEEAEKEVVEVEFGLAFG